MREAIYSWMTKLPAVFLAGVSGILGIVSSLFPDELSAFAGERITVATLQTVGFALYVIAPIYFLSLWLLKPSSSSNQIGVANVSTDVHIYLPLADIVGHGQLSETASGGLQPPLNAQTQAIEQPDSLQSAGNLDLAGIYVGQVVVSASSLAELRRLEIAIIGFNGSSEAVMFAEMEGRVRAGTGNISDYDDLALPALRETVCSNPGNQFVIVLHQEVLQRQAESFIEAFEEEGRVGLDFREFTIRVAARSDMENWVRLPLWDGVNIRRVDDIVSVRNVIAESVSFEAESAIVASGNREEC